MPTMRAHSPRGFSLAPILSLSLLLSACGGGGGGTTAPAPPSATNSAPVLDAIGNQTVSENTTAVTTVSGSDVDGNTLIYSLSGADATSFTLASSGGALAFSEAPNFESPASENGGNVYEVTITVSDGSRSDSESITVTVTDVLDDLTGRMVDGPISDALCRVVVDDTATSDEATTNEEGFFSFSDVIAGANTEVHCSGGIDTATGNDLTGLVLVTEVTAGTAVANVNAITTVLSAVEGEEEKQAILDKLGIEGTPEALTATDIWGDSETGDTGAQHAQRINAQLSMLLQTTATIVNEATGDSVDPTAISKAVVEQVVQATNEAGDNVNLSDPAVVSSILLDAVEAVAPAADVAPAVMNAVSSAVAEVNALLGDETENPTSDTAADIATVAQTSLQVSVSDVAGGQIDIDTFQQETNWANLFPELPTNDSTAPVISLEGDAQMFIEQGTSFTDLGASAQDAVDGAVQVTVLGSIDVNVAGNYTLTYMAADSAGNEASLDRTVTVADTTAPVVKLIGSGSITLDADAIYSEVGATANDSVDGILTVSITGSVGSAAGEYRITYSATDAAGNTGSVQRIVTVQPTNTPSDDVPLFVLSQGVVDDRWDRGIGAYDSDPSAPNDCLNDGGVGCPSIGWSRVQDSERGTVLEVAHSSSGSFGLIYVQASTGQNLTNYATGHLEFDIKVMAGDANFTMKLDCIFKSGCFSADQPLGEVGVNGWESVQMPMSQLRNAGLDITKVDTGIVIWATNTKSTVYRLDNVRFTGYDPDGTPPPPVVDVPFNLTKMGLGSYSDTINPASYICGTVDTNRGPYHYIYNAGVVHPQIGYCDPNNGPQASDARPRDLPQKAGEAANQLTMTHRWWGSLSFIGEMRVGNGSHTAYLIPDPIMARVTERGVRVRGIPTGMTADAGGFGNETSIPVPFEEVFDGIAIANSSHTNMDAKLLSYSEGSVTAGWFNGSDLVMDATFVYGSPYIFFTVYDGTPMVKVGDAATVDIWHDSGNSIGISTDVAGQKSDFLIVGNEGSSFSALSDNQLSISSPGNAFTLAWAHNTTASLRGLLETYSRNEVARVNIDYAVDRSNNTVTVSHRYLDAQGEPTETLAGLMPLQWKRVQDLNAVASARSARGVIKFAPLSAFDYQLPTVGVLPALPLLESELDESRLRQLVSTFVDNGPAYWNSSDRTELSSVAITRLPPAYGPDNCAKVNGWCQSNDSYWNGKAVGRAAEVLAIADQLGMTTEATMLRDWLKAELADWMSAESGGTLDSGNYFVYDENWSTLLGLEEAFSSHTLLQDHHFHYGYFIRAAAEVCRVDKAFCSAEQYGPMFELLIRDYAGGRDDPLFPYLRNFDPAFGFSWASGEVNFLRGNNNESTSEAANAYGAMVLYGLITGDDEITNRGMYLHASTSATYWEYWNDIDGWRGGDAEKRNFPPGYPRITTSIIWGNGSAFSTWFSPDIAHILGIQGLPANPLIMHVGLYADYFEEYVALGLSDPQNPTNLPSGLEFDQWTDLWWNLMAMTNPDAAIADYESTASYEVEAGESPAHTYHWIYTMQALGHLRTGTGELTADYPAAMAFERNGVTSYVVYNFSDEAITVTFSDGAVVEAAANAFAIEQR